MGEVNVLNNDTFRAEYVWTLELSFSNGIKMFTALLAVLTVTQVFENELIHH